MAFRASVLNANWYGWLADGGRGLTLPGQSARVIIKYLNHVASSSPFIHIVLNNKISSVLIALNLWQQSYYVTITKTLTVLLEQQ